MVLIKSMNYSGDYYTYKDKSEKPVSKLKYWKSVRSDFEEVMKSEILPLQRR